MNRPETRTTDAITDRPTITEQVVSLLEQDAPASKSGMTSPGVGRRPGTAKRSARRRVRVAPGKRVPDFGPDGADLFDAIEHFCLGFGGHCRRNMANIGVVLALLVLIVAANWATQPAAPLHGRRAGPTPAAQSLAVTDADTGDAKAQSDEAVAPAADSKVLPAAEPLAAVDAAKPPMTATAQVTEKIVSKPLPSAQSSAGTPVPTVPAAAPIQGVTLQASVTLRAELDPAKPLPAQIGNKAAVSPAPRTSRLPRRTTPPRATRRPVRHNAAPAQAIALEETVADPFTNGGAHDLDGPTAREQYQHLNKVTRSKHATRGN